MTRRISRRLAALDALHRGRRMRRGAVEVRHTILVIASHLLTCDSYHQVLDPAHFDEREC